MLCNAVKLQNSKCRHDVKTFLVAKVWQTQTETPPHLMLWVRKLIIAVELRDVPACNRSIGACADAPAVRILNNAAVFALCTLQAFSSLHASKGLSLSLRESGAGRGDTRYMLSSQSQAHWHPVCVSDAEQQARRPRKNPNVANLSHVASRVRESTSQRNAVWEL